MTYNIFRTIKTISVFPANPRNIVLIFFMMIFNFYKAHQVFFSYFLADTIRMPGCQVYTSQYHNTYQFH